MEGRRINKGVFNSKFHAALTDHKTQLQRMSCRCGWKSDTSIEKIYGSTIHPDLLEKQAIQGSKKSYQKASDSLNAESCKIRGVNSHTQIYRTLALVSEPLEKTRSSVEGVKQGDEAVSLIANIDGGHIKARGENRLFEAMIATVYRPENLEYVDKNHNKITSKTMVASAKDDGQASIKALFKSACVTQGLSAETTVTCLADGAANCYSIAHSIKKDCKGITYILDWFHIAMKFKNISIPSDYEDQFSAAKWHLWHGNYKKALASLDELKSQIVDVSIKTKLTKLSNYIKNNKDGIVNYQQRKSDGLVYTSNLAESTANTLINDRQKGKKKMLWNREGAHNVLQIRSSVQSKSWKRDWHKIENSIYKFAA